MFNSTADLVLPYPVSNCLS